MCRPVAGNPVSQDLAYSHFLFSTDQYYHRRKLSNAEPLRELPSGSTWNEGMRRDARPFLEAKIYESG
jgi:hypothetical protein